SGLDRGDANGERQAQQDEKSFHEGSSPLRNRGLERGESTADPRGKTCKRDARPRERAAGQLVKNRVSILDCTPSSSVQQTSRPAFSALIRRCCGPLPPETLIRLGSLKKNWMLPRPL